MVELVMWDLDETIVQTHHLEALRHGDEPIGGIPEELHHLVPHPGVLRAVTVRQPFRLVLVTSSPAWYVDAILGLHLNEHRFEFVVTYDDVENIKPDPEPVRRALELTSVDPQRALYIGDDVVDHLACEAAGVRFLGAGWAAAPTYPADCEELAHPDDLIGLLSDRGA